MTKVTGILRNWVWDKRGIYWGNVYNDINGRFRDGTWIHTSLVEEYNPDAKRGDLITTLNSVYLLGNPKEN